MAANIIQGGKSVITVRLLQPSGDPYDLTNCTAMQCCFQNDDGTEVTLALNSGVSIVSAPAGKLTITLTSIQSALLRVLQLATLEIAFTLSTDPNNMLKVQVPQAYNVIQSQC